MSSAVSITLSSNDWGQIIAGLECRREVWDATARYLGGQEVDSMIEECSDEEEARNLVAIYDRLISELRAQLRK